MERFKIKHFESEHEGESFPHFTTLTCNECEDIINRLHEKLGMTADENDLLLVSKISLLQVHHDGNNAADSQFHLEEFLGLIDISSPEAIYINWYRFHKIDKMLLSDLSNFFGDIWYPGPDDIDIFDSSLMWILSINHEGYIQYIKFP